MRTTYKPKPKNNEKGTKHLETRLMAIIVGVVIALGLLAMVFANRMGGETPTDPRRAYCNVNISALCANPNGSPTYP